jgi:protein SPA2
MYSFFPLLVIFASFSHSTTATSVPLLQKLKSDDQLVAVSADDAILDAHLTAFFTAIDSLLLAGRSSALTRVFTPMISVVNAVTNILDDVRSHSRWHLDPESVHALEERVEATLSNLISVSKTHATSSGVSPVSLLDAAAGHVSAAVTELGRVAHLRRATKAEQEQFTLSSLRTTDNSFTPHLRTVEEVRPSVAWQGEWEREQVACSESELRSNNRSMAGLEGTWIELRVRTTTRGLSVRTSIFVLD